MVQEEELVRFFEDVEPKVLQQVYAETKNHGYAQYLEIIRSRLPNYNIKTLLDIGCGEGTPLVNYLKMGYDAEGIDYSQNVLKLAKKNLLDNGYVDSFNPFCKQKCREEYDLS